MLLECHTQCHFPREYILKYSDLIHSTPYYKQYRNRHRQPKADSTNRRTRGQGYCSLHKWLRCHNALRGVRVCEIILLTVIVAILSNIYPIVIAKASAKARSSWWFIKRAVGPARITRRSTRVG